MAAIRWKWTSPTSRLKHLLLVRFYGDPEFARSFRYDREDIARARANEQFAAAHRLARRDREPAHGKTRSPCASFCAGYLDELSLSRKRLGCGMIFSRWSRWRMVRRTQPREFVPNSRAIWGRAPKCRVAMLRSLAEDREQQVRKDVEAIAASSDLLGDDSGKIAEFLAHAREQSLITPGLAGPLPRRRAEPSSRLHLSGQDR